MTIPAVADRLMSAAWPGTLRPYQRHALAELQARWDTGGNRAWVVLPPGAGKTLVGLEAARRLGRQVVVFAPNTAIQNQWVAHWRRFSPAVATAQAGRGLDSDICVMTYQSLAIFDPDAETDEDGRDLVAGSGGRGGTDTDRSLLGRLHKNGRDLIASLATAGPLTLVLDECHHLLDVWGRLLAEVLDQLPDAIVIGLTATPPASLTTEEATLVDTLFGVPVLGASIPALVRQDYLASFAELAWLTPPTAVETAYIAQEAERFAELTTDLLDPEFARTGFLEWLDARFVRRATRTSGEAVRMADRMLAWARVEKDDPDLAAAALRLHYAGLLALPPGARLREEHRHEPAAADWVELLGDYVHHCLRASADDKDVAAAEAIRRALPAVGYQLTKRGIRSARSPVDRVLARSAAKTHGAVEIAANEAAGLGDRLRCLVLCDHERVSARLPARLTDVLDSEAGSAWLMLANLAADARTRELNPVLVTGRTVAASPDTARHFMTWAGERGVPLTVREDDDLAVLEGEWSSRKWVPLVTEYFETGRCQVLIGTRALLGEGWDARGVNALIDLTTATTATSVVQTRGRALRKDPSWPEKVANTWTVVCLTDRHPKGAADWDRFVRKHEGYLAATADGEIVSGVAHVDAGFSPYAPPPVTDCDAINAAMLERAAGRPATRAAWGIGTDFGDRLVHTIRVRPDRRHPKEAVAVSAGVGVGAGESLPKPPIRVPAETGAAPPLSPGSRQAIRWLGVAACVLGCLVGFAAGVTAGDAVSAEAFWRLPAGTCGALLMAIALSSLTRWFTGRWAGRRLEAAADDPPLARFAYAVADGLAACRLTNRGAEGVEIRVEPDGSYRFCLADVDTAASERFAVALEELLSPMAAPRYMVPRYVLRRRTGRAYVHRGRAWLRAAARADGVVYHSVPTSLAQNRRRAERFATAWNRWVSSGRPLYAATPEGEGVLVTHRGEDPLSATTTLRIAWF